VKTKWLIRTASAGGVLLVLAGGMVVWRRSTPPKRPAPVTASSPLPQRATWEQFFAGHRTGRATAPAPRFTDQGRSIDGENPALAQQRPAAEQPALETLRAHWAASADFLRFAADARLDEGQRAHVLDQLAFAEYQAASLRNSVPESERLVRQLFDHARAVASTVLTAEQRELLSKSGLLQPSA
jgi:hypothetical protein